MAVSDEKLARAMRHECRRHVGYPIGSVFGGNFALSNLNGDGRPEEIVSNLDSSNRPLPAVAIRGDYRRLLREASRREWRLLKLSA